MIPPHFDDFDSTEIAAGRIYQVHGRTRCIAYGIDDRTTLRALGAVDGLIVFAFMEYAGEAPHRLGHWYGAFHADDLLEAMETMRAALDPAAPRPQHRPLHELIDERIQQRAVFRIDIDVDTER